MTLPLPLVHEEVWEVHRVGRRPAPRVGEQTVVWFRIVIESPTLVEPYTRHKLFASPGLFQAVDEQTYRSERAASTAFRDGRKS